MLVLKNLARYSPEQTLQNVAKIREKLRDQIIILTHHYQRKEIVDIGDLVGDSLMLSRAASLTDRSKIIFCGVHFMAESASILAQPSQEVYLPNLFAGCPMADMADLEKVELAWKQITEILGEHNLIPITYMNSSAELKAFCGAHGGCVCTSTNAPRVFRWALQRADTILFFPDEHLGRNTANGLKIDPERIVVWDPRSPLAYGAQRDKIAKATIILWKGYCHVHTHFTPADVMLVRQRYPGCKVVVHPECIQEVVKLADANGSTEFICRYVREAPPGSTIAVGTEINLIDRLARDNPDKRVFELSRSLCPNMFRISPHNLLWTLQNLDKTDNVVRVPSWVKREAKIALERMLELGADPTLS
jgi:quinolinate synthase